MFVCVWLQQLCSHFSVWSLIFLPCLLSPMALSMSAWTISAWRETSCTFTNGITHITFKLSAYRFKYRLCKNTVANECLIIQPHQFSFYNLYCCPPLSTLLSVLSHPGLSKLKCSVSKFLGLKTFHLWSKWLWLKLPNLSSSLGWSVNAPWLSSVWAHIPSALSLWRKEDKNKTNHH